MTLTRALAPAAASTTRARGAHYFTSGAVVHFDPQQSMAYAVVRGTEDYVVRLEVAGHEIRGTCTCPFFNDRLEACKHLWAVALTCDARGVLQPPDTIGGAAIDFVAVPLDGRASEHLVVDDPEFRTPDSHPASPRPRTHGARPPAWQQALAAITASAGETASRPEAPPGQLLYVIDLAGSRQSRTLLVHLLRQEQKQSGEWGAPKPARISNTHVALMEDPDRTILERLAGARPAYAWSWSGVGTDVPSPFHLRGALARDLLPVICATGRCRLALSEIPTARPQDSPLVALAWDERQPLRSTLHIVRDDGAGAYTISGTLEGDGSAIPIGDVRLLLDEGIVLTDSRAFAIDPSRVTAWMQQLHERGSLTVPLEQAGQLRDALIASGAADVEGLPGELRTTVVETPPVPHLTLSSHLDDRRHLQAELAFSYDGGPTLPASASPLAPTRDPRVMARRDAGAEQRAHQRLIALGVRQAWNSWEHRPILQIAASEMPRAVRALVSEGWDVRGDGHRYRLATAMPALDVRSGVDWFELHGDAHFDEHRVTLPALLEAIKRHQGTITLDDGTFGIVPEAWLRDLAPLAIGTRTGDHVRFQRSQVALLDALLAARPAVSWDATAAIARDRLRAFDTIAPLDPPSSFCGTLREYQREGLGWLAFLREFGFGGCLADDMGLGKTVVVLALLEARRHARETEGRAPRPSLVVVPRSVLFNWQQEAARFAPRLRVLDFSGSGRRDRMHHIGESDLVLVTYGTLRRDAAELAGVEFDYLILDEAQTIKNANTAAAKAARVLRGEHRLALSGTPVENRIGDLWSLFEFLNPGLLSGASAFGRSFSGGADTDELRALGRGLRPFILRRTKEQVASELPVKTEQTIVCDLERPQRALYNELRDHYRRTLLGNSTSWQQSKLQVLEALLRLRQAACHPALVDAGRAAEPSAKLDLLVPRLVETIEEGHKALVFSQFTTFLALLRRRLDEKGITYEYLDGRTKDREHRVERFQNDRSCPLFLISLKAGGVGLNLTAADYVFILDPWWNPAAEAQAVDRTHRIGQTRRVFAYRLIARDTVEERVLELQQRKRDLADAIMTSDNSVIRTLRREDLELLLT